MTSDRYTVTDHFNPKRMLVDLADHSNLLIALNPAHRYWPVKGVRS